MHTINRNLGAVFTHMRWIDISFWKLTDIHNLTRQAERNTGEIITNTHTHKQEEKQKKKQEYCDYLHKQIVVQQKEKEIGLFQKNADADR